MFCYCFPSLPTVYASSLSFTLLLCELNMFLKLCGMKLRAEMCVHFTESNRSTCDSQWNRFRKWPWWSRWILFSWWIIMGISLMWCRKHTCIMCKLSSVRIYSHSWIFSCFTANSVTWTWASNAIWLSFSCWYSVVWISFRASNITISMCGIPGSHVVSR